jgi:hypothetical protein
LLAAGETKTVAIEITPESLAFYDIKMKYVVEPGDFEIMVGNSSRDADLQSVVLTVENNGRLMPDIASTAETSCEQRSELSPR